MLCLPKYVLYIGWYLSVYCIQTFIKIIQQCECKQAIDIIQANSPSPTKALNNDTTYRRFSGPSREVITNVFQLIIPL